MSIFFLCQLHWGRIGCQIQYLVQSCLALGILARILTHEPYEVSTQYLMVAL